MSQDFSEFAALFRQVFRGREDVVPRYYVAKKTGRQGYSPVCSNRFKEGICRLQCWTCPNPSYVPLSDDLLSQHFTGKEILGVYPLLPDGSCWFVAADFDDHGDNGGPPRDPLRDATGFHACCEAQGIPCYLERSKSGKGLHAWIFFDAPVPAWKARAVAFAMLGEAGVIVEDEQLSSFDRLFPNQDKLTGKGFGNLIALPFQGKAAEHDNTLFLDPATGFKKPCQYQPDVLRTIQHATEADLDRIIEAWGLKAGAKPSGAGAGAPAHGDLDASGCAFVIWCKENPAAVPEPLWYALISNVARLPGGRTLCHEISRGHPQYDQGETDAKILQALDASAPHTCQWIKGNGYDCGKDCRVKSPVAILRRKTQAKDQGDDDKEPSHLVVARSVVASFGTGNLINTAAFTWRWNGAGVWKQVEPREVKQRIHETAPGGMIKKSFVDSVHDLVQTEVLSAFKVTDGKHFRLSEGIGARGNGLGGRGQEYGFKRN